MPKRGKIAPVERRGWLERYEQGTSIDSLARDAGRTQRTVTDHLERARRERQHDQVQADLIRDGYREHYRDLLHLAERLAESSQSPHRGEVLGAGDPGERLLYQGLRSHTHGSRLWTAVRGWEEDATGLAEELDRLELEATHLVTKEAAGFPEVLTEGFAGSLRHAVSMAAQGLDPEATEYLRDPSGGTLQLRFGSFILADRVPDEARLTKIQQKHGALLKGLLAPESAFRLRSLWRGWAEARDVIQEEVTILGLRKVLPGHCDLCPAGDTGARRPPSRRRDE